MTTKFAGFTVAIAQGGIVGLDGQVMASTPILIAPTSANA